MKNKLIKKYVLSLALMLTTMTSLVAQQASKPKSEAIENMTWFAENMVFIFGVIVFLVGFAAIFSVFDKMVKLERLKLLAEKGLLTTETVMKENKESLFQKWYKKSWNIVPIEKEKDILLEHPHDGIYELDNKLPPWWLALFYITIVYGVFHLGYHHFSAYGKTQAEEYEIAMAKAEIEINEYLANQSNLVDETNVEMLTDEAKIASGAKIFTERCAVCHGALGEGGIGPNVTDAYWLHGGDIKEVFKTVKYGVSGKGMQAWKDDLTAGQMHEVSSYILTLQGTDPPNAKEPQGQIYAAAEE